MIAFADGELAARGWTSFDNLACLAATKSSNDLAREFIELYFDEDQRLPATVILAESQPEARGRKGRWVAPAGRGLYFTLVRPVSGQEPLSLLPIAVARWVRDAIEQETGVAARVKWPNDLYVGRRKLAGVLAESRTQGETTYVAVGIGINVCGSAQALGLPDATTVEEEAQQSVALSRLAQAILDRLDRELAEPRWDSQAPAWEKVCAHRHGDKITVLSAGGEISGDYAGITGEGFLRLETREGERVVVTGEVIHW